MDEIVLGLSENVVKRSCKEVSTLYLSLNHEDSLSSQLFEKLKDVKIFFSLHSLQHAVQDNEGSCPPYSSTAVDQQGAGIRVRMSCTHTFDKIDKNNSILRYTMVRPASEVKLSHFKRRTVGRCRLYQDMIKISYMSVLTKKALYSNS